MPSPGVAGGHAGIPRGADPHTHRRTKKGRLKASLSFCCIVSRYRWLPRTDRAIPLPAVLSFT